MLEVKAFLYTDTHRFQSENKKYFFHLRGAKFQIYIT